MKSKPNSNFQPNAFDVNRRSFLTRSSFGVGGIALSQLIAANQSTKFAAASSSSKTGGGIIREPHYPIRAKRIIHLAMAGGPSQCETLDPKPEMRKRDGEPFPESLTKGQQLAQLQNTILKVRGPFVDFKRFGKCGTEISELLPNIGGIADEICVIRSMVTEQINHDPAQAFMNSGSILNGRPSMGSWLLYGLGAETENLPGFIVLVSQGKGGGAQPISARQWSSGFLPGKYQGVQFQSKGDAVHFIGSPEGVCQSTQRLVVEEIQRQNGFLTERQYDPEIQTRISQYELAFRMQTSIPELTDFSRESTDTLELYGVKEAGDGSFASNCLLARRLAERGVRFIQLYHRAWDHHSDIEKNLPLAAGETDRASAALVADLKQRGMLDDTLIIWGGEFGRTPMGQGSGRDHHINAFSIWLAGGGIKPGIVFGGTDEFAYSAIENVVTMHDLHATILRLCGIDFNRFSVKFQGLDARLTGVETPHVVDQIVA